jgi:hypothetical protein
VRVEAMEGTASVLPLLNRADWPATKVFRASHTPCGVALVAFLDGLPEPFPRKGSPAGSGRSCSDGAWKAASLATPCATAAKGMCLSGAAAWFTRFRDITHCALRACCIGAPVGRSQLVRSLQGPVVGRMRMHCPGVHACGFDGQEAWVCMHLAARFPSPGSE